MIDTKNPVSFSILVGVLITLVTLFVLFLKKPCNMTKTHRDKRIFVWSKAILFSVVVGLLIMGIVYAGMILKKRLETFEILEKPKNPPKFLENA